MVPNRYLNMVQTDLQSTFHRSAGYVCVCVCVVPWTLICGRVQGQLNRTGMPTTSSHWSWPTSSTATAACTRRWRPTRWARRPRGAPFRWSPRASESGARRRPSSCSGCRRDSMPSTRSFWTRASKRSARSTSNGETNALRPNRTPPLWGGCPGDLAGEADGLDRKLYNDNFYSAKRLFLDAVVRTVGFPRSARKCTLRC